jgi:hypothetical protein
MERWGEVRNVSSLRQKGVEKSVLKVQVHCLKFKESKCTLVERNLYITLFKAFFGAKYLIVPQMLLLELYS